MPQLPANYLTQHIGYLEKEIGYASLRLGDTAPDFEADTTEGKLSFHYWIGGSWAVLFSHSRRDVASAVARQAAAWRADLIVMTRRPGPAIYRLILGSVPDQVMRERTARYSLSVRIGRLHHAGSHRRRAKDPARRKAEPSSSDIGGRDHALAVRCGSRSVEHEVLAEPRAERTTRGFRPT